MNMSKLYDLHYRRNHFNEKLLFMCIVNTSWTCQQKNTQKPGKIQYYS